MMERLNKLWKRGCDFLNVDYSIICGAMSWVSNPNLTSSVSNAGGFGVLAGGAMSPEMLQIEIEKTKKLTKNSFGVNLIVMHQKIEQLIDSCIECKVKYVVLAGSIPKSSLIKKLKDSNIKVITFAPTATMGKKLCKIGVDALIIEGSEAGGHIGPVSTSILAQEILPEIKEVPIFVAGGIGTGAGIVSYLQMGASGCQLGTIFACSKESPAHQNFKAALIKAKARDAIILSSIDSRFPVIPVRALSNKGTEKFQEVQRNTISKFEDKEISMEDAKIDIEKFWLGALRRSVIDGDVEYGSIMAGQSVGFVKNEEPVQKIIENLIENSLQFLNKID